jgi:hypothetical protein
MRRWWPSLLLVLALSCQGPQPPAPQPSPAPEPSPSPSPATPGPPFAPPLRVEGAQFVDAAGRNPDLVGVIGCCTDRMWPFASPELLVAARVHGANLLHIRLGPFWTAEHVGQTARPYVQERGLADLSRFNPDWEALLVGWLEAAHGMGFYVEVDVIDAWLLERPYAHPWAAGNNTSGADAGDCSITASAPGSVERAWIHEVVRLTGRFENVTYQISNESWCCAELAAAWEQGVARALRLELSAQGFPPHLIGTNAGDWLRHNRGVDSTWADYETLHLDGAACAAHPAGECVRSDAPRPVMVNEYPGDPPPAAWGRLLREGKRGAVQWHLWLGDLTPAEIDASLDQILAYRERQ